MTKKIILSTTIWGTEYINNFLNYTLPSLISKGNILDKFEGFQLSFFISTRRKNLSLFNKNKNIKKITKHLNLKYILIDDFLSNETNDKYQVLRNSQRDILKKSITDNFDFLMLLYPDSIVSENYIKNCIKFIKNSDLVLSPGPLCSLESYKEHLKNEKKPFAVDSLKKFAFHNLHHFYKSFINQKNANYVNIYKTDDHLIFNCYDLHISIINVSILDPDIKFDTIDSNYLSKLSFDYQRIKYANSQKDLMVLSYESNFSERPYYYYDNYSIEKLNFREIHHQFYTDEPELKKYNYKNGIYIIYLGNNIKENIFSDHIKKISDVDIINKKNISNAYIYSGDLSDKILIKFKRLGIVGKIMSKTIFTIVKYFIIISKTLHYVNIIRVTLMKMMDLYRKLPYFLKIYLRNKVHRSPYLTVKKIQLYKFLYT